MMPAIMDTRAQYLPGKATGQYQILTKAQRFVIRTLVPSICTKLAGKDIESIHVQLFENLEKIAFSFQLLMPAELACTISAFYSQYFAFFSWTLQTHWKSNRAKRNSPRACFSTPSGSYFQSKMHLPDKES